MSFFKQNANITLRKKWPFLFFRWRLIFPNFHTNASPNHDDIGWQAHYLYLSAPSVVWQMRSKLNCQHQHPKICLESAVAQCLWGNDSLPLHPYFLVEGAQKKNSSSFILVRMMKTRFSSLDSIFPSLVSATNSCCSQSDDSWSKRFVSEHFAFCVAYLLSIRFVMNLSNEARKSKGLKSGLTSNLRKPSSKVIAAWWQTRKITDLFVTKSFINKKPTSRGLFRRNNNITARFHVTVNVMQFVCFFCPFSLNMNGLLFQFNSPCLPYQDITVWTWKGPEGDTSRHRWQHCKC